MSNIFARALCYFRGEHQYETICMTCGKRSSVEDTSLYIKNNMATKEQLTQLSTDVEAIKDTVGKLSSGLTSMEQTLNDLKAKQAVGEADDPTVAAAIVTLEATIAEGKASIASLPSPDAVIVPTGADHATATPAAPADAPNGGPTVGVAPVPA